MVCIICSIANHAIQHGSTIVFITYLLTSHVIEHDSSTILYKLQINRHWDVTKIRPLIYALGSTMVCVICSIANHAIQHAGVSPS